MWLDKGDIALLGLLGTVFAGGVAFIGGTAAHGINMAIVENNAKKHDAKIEAAKTQFEQTVANKIDLSNIDLASVELAKTDTDYVIKLFGSTSVEEIMGVKYNEYLNAFFNISENSAKKVLDAVDKVTAESRMEMNSNENFVGYGEANHWKFSESARLERHEKASVAFYEAISEAVENAYSTKVENIAEASNMNNKISNYYRVTRPEIVGDTTVGGFLTHGSTTFVNAGVMTTSISQVVIDTENNRSYFFIDTLQGRANDGDIVIESCRAMVEIDRTDLSQEEVYSQFITGNCKFKEIVREKVGTKSGVVNNQVQEGVDEIELY